VSGDASEANLAALKASYDPEGERERLRVEEAEAKPASERNHLDWLYINMSPYSKGQGCHCGH
jgi:hypothetical protein